jgi:hypothetical protein
MLQTMNDFFGSRPTIRTSTTVRPGETVATSPSGGTMTVKFTPFATQTTNTGGTSTGTAAGAGAGTDATSGMNSTAARTFADYWNRLRAWPYFWPAVLVIGAALLWRNRKALGIK